MLDWDTLRVVLALAREGTLIGAARQLDVNQATASRHLSRAEAALKAKLFNRRHKGLIPTEAGRAAIAAAHEIEDKISALHAKVHGADLSEDGQLHLSVPQNALSRNLSADIQSFQGRYPGIAFDINATDEEMDFADLDVDVVIRVCEEPPHSLWGYRISRVAEALYATDRFLSRWQGRMTEQPAAVELPFVALADSRQAERRAEVVSSFPEAKVIGTCNTADSFVSLVRSGVGIGQMMQYIAEPHADLVKVRDCGPGWSHDVWILTHRDHRETRRIRAFMDFIRDRFNERDGVF
ncbi:MAG: LysR family transcriptional regulator [Pseudomonadota bacterium]